MKIQLLLILLLPAALFAQQPADSTLIPPDFKFNNKDPVAFNRPGKFEFIKNIPADMAGFARCSFAEKKIHGLALITFSTGLLMMFDQQITNGVQDAGEDHKIVSRESFSPIIHLKTGSRYTNIGKLPKNFNTALYDLGQGSSAMLLASAFFIKGKLSHDNRALQTASQLTEAFITLGIGTQVMKYFTGRENPSDATVPGGRWRPFPSWKNFQNNKTKFDAFPSGHLATFVSAITIISNNYPEKRWIAPVGFSIAGLCGLAMINNGVHWAGDFPLGFALGYGFGKYISKKARWHAVHG